MSTTTPVPIPISELPRSVQVPAYASRLILPLAYFGLIGYGVFAVVYTLAQDGFALGSVLPMAGAMALTAVLGYLSVVVFRFYLPAEHKKLAASWMRLGFALLATFLYPMMELEAFFPGVGNIVVLSCFGAGVGAILLTALSQFLLERSGFVPKAGGSTDGR